MFNWKWKKNATIFLTNDLFNGFSLAVFNLSMTWYIYELTSSAVGVTIVGIMGHIATFLFSPISGSIADQKNPLKLLKLSNVISSILIIILICGLLLLNSTFQLYIIYLVLFLMSVVNTINFPAESKIIPNIVETTDEVTNLYGLRTSIDRISSLLGNMSSGFIILFIGTIGSLIFNSTVYLLIALMLSLLTLKKPFKIAEEPDETFKFSSIFSLNSFKKGLSEIMSNNSLRKVTIISLLVNISSIVGSLYIILITTHYSGNAASYGILNAFGIIGSILAGATLFLYKNINTDRVISFSWIISGILMIILTVNTHLILAYLLYSLIAYFLTVGSVKLTTSMILIIEETKRGTTVGVIQSLSVLLIPICSLIAAYITDLTNVIYIFIVAGFWIIIIGLFCLKNGLTNTIQK